MRSLIFTLPFMLSTLVGCKTLEQRLAVVQVAANGGTYGALVAMEATKAEAEKFRVIALDVKTITAGGMVDWVALEQQIVARITEAFPNDKDVLLSMVSTISALIQASLPAESPPSELLLYVNAAATGSADGCTFYIARPMTASSGARTSLLLPGWSPKR